LLLTYFFAAQKIVIAANEPRHWAETMPLMHADSIDFVLEVVS
jgi:hypothetical protein